MLVHLAPHPRKGNQSVANNTEERSDAPYGEHVLLVSCRKAGTVGDHIADILPPAGKSARQPAGRINDRKRDSRNNGQIEHEYDSCEEKAKNNQHASLQPAIIISVIAAPSLRVSPGLSMFHCNRKRNSRTNVSYFGTRRLLRFEPW